MIYSMCYASSQPVKILAVNFDKSGKILMKANFFFSSRIWCDSNKYGVMLLFVSYIPGFMLIIIF